MWFECQAVSSAVASRQGSAQASVHPAHARCMHHWLVPLGSGRCDLLPRPALDYAETPLEEPSPSGVCSRLTLRSVPSHLSFVYHQECFAGSRSCRRGARHCRVFLAGVNDLLVQQQGDWRSIVCRLQDRARSHNAPWLTHCVLWCPASPSRPHGQSFKAPETGLGLGVPPCFSLSRSRRVGAAAAAAGQAATAPRFVCEGNAIAAFGQATAALRSAAACSVDDRNADAHHTGPLRVVPVSYAGCV